VTSSLKTVTDKASLDNGVNIPQAYTSFLAPVYTPKLYYSALSYQSLKHMETPYVVHFRQVEVLAPAKPVWSFVHPNSEIACSSKFNDHNKRYQTLDFEIKNETLVVCSY
jgi:protein arginine N-methyltransferase 5